MSYVDLTLVAFRSMIVNNMISSHRNMDIFIRISRKEKSMSLVIQGVNVYLTDCGSGSPVLFLHGAPDSAEMWNGVIEHLKDQHHCFAPDLPGFGRSTAPADFNCSLENMARFLDKLIEEAAIPTPLNLVVADFAATYGLAWAVSY